jgi:hypothetical protein
MSGHSEIYLRGPSHVAGTSGGAAGYPLHPRAEVGRGALCRRNSSCQPKLLHNATCYSHPPWVRYGGMPNRTATIIPKQGECMHAQLEAGTPSRARRETFASPAHATNLFAWSTMARPRGDDRMPSPPFCGAFGPMRSQGGWHQTVLQQARGHDKRRRCPTPRCFVAPPRRQPARGRGNECFPFPFLGGIRPARFEAVCLRSSSP